MYTVALWVPRVRSDVATWEGQFQCHRSTCCHGNKISTQSGNYDFFLLNLKWLEKCAERSPTVKSANSKRKRKNLKVLNLCFQIVYGSIISLYQTKDIIYH